MEIPIINSEIGVDENDNPTFFIYASTDKENAPVFYCKTNLEELKSKSVEQLAMNIASMLYDLTLALNKFKKLSIKTH